MKSMLFELLLAVIFLALVAELIARIFYFQRKKRIPLLLRYPTDKALFFRPHPYCLYVKTENLGWPYPSNELGYVGKRYISLQKPQSKKRLYFVGGSTTEEAEQVYGPESHWPGQLTELLNKKIGAEKFECINAACAGYTTAESLTEFIFRGIDLNPDYLIIYHNVNDVWTVQMLESFSADYSAARIPGLLRRPILSSLPQVPIFFIYQALRQRLSQSRRRGLINYIADPPWNVINDFDESRLVPFRRNILSMIYLSRSFSCTPIIVNWEYSQTTEFTTGYFIGEAKHYNSIYKRYIAENNKILQEIATSLDVLYANVGPFEGNYFQPDGMHFNQNGRTELATRLSYFLHDKLT